MTPANAQPSHLFTLVLHHQLLASPPHLPSQPGSASSGETLEALLDHSILKLQFDIT